MSAEESKEKVKDYMSSPVTSINSEATLQEAGKLMKVKNLSALLVKKNNDYVGIVTERDFARKAAGEGLDLKTASITAITSTPIHTTDVNEDIFNANMIMSERHIRHLAVTDNGEIIGMLSNRDFYKFNLNLFNLD